MKKLILLYSSFKDYGGAQRILLYLKEYLTYRGDICVSSLNDYSQINHHYSIKEEDYIKFNLINILKYFNNSIVLSFHRKPTTILIILRKILSLNITLIHNARNEYCTLKAFSLFPPKNIAVSESVKRNLVNYFNLDNQNISVIYNGIRDYYHGNFQLQLAANNKITLLYPARITQTKYQVEFVKLVRNHLPDNFQIIFAGDGEDFENLKEACKGYPNFIILGFIENIYPLILQSDYVILFSKREGLPSSLVESAMLGRPLIVNRQGGKLEIVKNNYNGFVLDSANEMKDIFKKLEALSLDQYKTMCYNSRIIYEDKFSFNNMITKYKNYIDDLYSK